MNKQCKTCGASVPNEAKFCQACGGSDFIASNPQQQVGTNYDNSPNQPSYSQNQYNQQPPVNQAWQPPVPQNQPKKKNVGLIIGIVAAVLVVLAAIGIIAEKAFQKQGYGSDIDSGYSSDIAEYNDDNKDTSNDSPVTNYDTGVTLSSNLDDFTFKIDDVVYKLPIEIEAFTGNGWSFHEYFDDYDKTIDSDHTDFTSLTKGDSEIDIDVFNLSGNTKPFKECPVGRLSYDFDGSAKIYLAGDYLLNGKTVDEVTAHFGKPVSQEDYGVYIEVLYEKTGADWIYERYTFQFDTETKVIKNINIVNYIKTETSVNDASDTAYLSKYVAPTKLGDNTASFNVSIMGGLYNLPAPVSEFTKNGWEIIESSDVGAGTYVNEGITMRKNGVTAKFGVYNFSKLQVNAKDATIYEVNVDDYEFTEINLILPGNIKLGSTKADVEKVLGNSAVFSKDGDYDSYSYLINDDGAYLKIWLSEDVVASITVIHRECPYK